MVGRCQPFVLVEISISTYTYFWFIVAYRVIQGAVAPRMLFFCVDCPIECWLDKLNLSRQFSFVASHFHQLSAASQKLRRWTCKPEKSNSSLEEAKRITYLTIIFLLSLIYVVCESTYCNPEKNRFCDFVFPMILEVPWVQKSGFWKMSVCLCVCTRS